MKLLIILGIVLTVWRCKGFDIPHEVCHYRVKIENDHYNMSRAIDIGDATPVDAHYDIFGNLFYVARGRSDKGVVFDVYVLEANADLPAKVQGKFQINLRTRHNQVIYPLIIGEEL